MNIHSQRIHLQKVEGVVKTVVVTVQVLKKKATMNTKKMSKSWTVVSSIFPKVLLIRITPNKKRLNNFSLKFISIKNKHIIKKFSP